MVALVAMPVFSLPFSVALLVGAALAATDPAILIPLFDRLRLRPKVSQTVIAESAFNDATATVLVLTVAGVVEAGNVGATEPLTDFSKSLALGAALGIGGGLLLAAMLSSHAVGIWRESPAVAILAIVALTYFTTDELGGSAYLAAFVMGLIVGNMERLGLGRHADHAKQLDDFMTQASEIAVLAVFVTLGINLPLDALWDNLWGGLVVMVVFLFVARPSRCSRASCPTGAGGGRERRSCSSRGAGRRASSRRRSPGCCWRATSRARRSSRRWSRSRS